MGLLEKSWNAFSPEIAKKYLDGFGAPALTSLEIVRDLLIHLNPSTLLDFGCGNAHVFGMLKPALPALKYTGIDYSEALLNVARQKYPEARFCIGNISKGDLSIPAEELFDAALYSHTLEMLESPEQSLAAAKARCRKIVIRFFDPPQSRPDEAELRTMDLGQGEVPYLRRKISTRYYHMILDNLGIHEVEVYRDPCSADEVHILKY